MPSAPTSRCLVIGANGFIGSHITDALARAGHEVTAFDRFSGPVAFDHSGVRRVVGDFLNRGDVRDAVRGQDLVLHLLSTTTPLSAENDPTFDIRTNIAASVELFTACVDAGVGRVFVASTGGAIYGQQPGPTFSETDPALPVSPYAIGKLAIEHYLQYFRVKYGLDSVALRISNPYGTRQRAHKRQGVIPIFLHQAAAGRPVKVFGDGSMVRDYLYLADLVEMVLAMVERPCRFGVYNIGSGVGHTVNEIVGTIRSTTGLKVHVQYTPAPATFVHHVTLDVTRFTEEFGVVAKVGLADGITRLWSEMCEQAGHLA